MKKEGIYSFLFLCFIVLNSCDEVSHVNCDESNPQGNYIANSSELTDYVYKHLISPSPFTQTIFFAEPYSYSEPCFNPNNPNEIIYLRKHNNAGPGTLELYKYSFCSGEASILANNVAYSLDWNSKGWISYTANDYKIYKIKDNGDSLTQISFLSSYNFNCKWSPDGERFFFKNDGTGTYIADKNGNIIKPINVPYPQLWLDTANILTVVGGNFVAFNVTNENTTILNTNYANAVLSICYYDKVNSNCYVSMQNGIGMDDYYLRYSFLNNTLDTLRMLYDSYKYYPGSYCASTNKIILPLARVDWLDSVENWWLVRQNIMIMDPDGTNERLVNLP